MRERERRAVRRIVVPQSIHERMVVHSAATLTGIALSLRMGSGKPLWIGATWYGVAFVGFHLAMLPVVATFMAVTHGVERWVRAIVQEELIRFDLQSYDRQLRRLLPHAREDDDRTP